MEKRAGISIVVSFFVLFWAIPFAHTAPCESEPKMPAQVPAPLESVLEHIKIPFNANSIECRGFKLAHQQCRDQGAFLGMIDEIFHKLETGSELSPEATDWLHAHQNGEVRCKSGITPRNLKAVTFQCLPPQKDSIIHLKYCCEVKSQKPQNSCSEYESIYKESLDNICIRFRNGRQRIFDRIRVRSPSVEPFKLTE